MRFRAGQHLRRNADFGAVREQGRRTDCGAFLLTWRVRPATATAETETVPAPIASRVGIVASRAAVGNAVQRNRAKRRLRAIFRQHQQLVPAGLDLVLTARTALLRMEFSEVEQRFVQVCRKLVPPPPHV